MIIIDSNIWNYYFDDSAKENKYIAEHLEKFVEKEKVGVNTVIVMEVSHFLVKNLGPKLGKEKIEKFLELPLMIADFDYDLMRNSLDSFYETTELGIGGRDSTILATLKKFRTKELFTHDDAFKRVKWVKVFDPIPKSFQQLHE